MVFADRNDVMIPCFFLNKCNFWRMMKPFLLIPASTFTLFICPKPDIIFNTSRVFWHPGILAASMKHIYQTLIALRRRCFHCHDFIFKPNNWPRPSLWGFGVWYISGVILTNPNIGWIKQYKYMAMFEGFAHSPQTQHFEPKTTSLEKEKHRPKPGFWRGCGIFWGWYWTQVKAVSSKQEIGQIEEM